MSEVLIKNSVCANRLQHSAWRWKSISTRRSSSPTEISEPVSYTCTHIHLALVCMAGWGWAGWICTVSKFFCALPIRSRHRDNLHQLAWDGREQTTYQLQVPLGQFRKGLTYEQPGRLRWSCTQQARSLVQLYMRWRSPSHHLESTRGGQSRRQRNQQQHLLL